MRQSRRVSEISESATLALAAYAKRLASEGRDILSMAVGEPDYDAPAEVQERARDFVGSGKVRYTPSEGSLSLRQVISQHLRDTRGVAYTPEEICVCHSAKHALSGALLSLVEPGDEVLLLLPSWTSYHAQIRFAGGVPVGVEPGERCRPNVQGLERAIGERTRGILLNSPGNPSGYVMERAEVEAIAALCERRDLWILSDEIYRRLVYEGEPNVSPASLSPALRERTVIVDGASKTFAMTGYRIGFAAAPREITAAMGRLHSQLTGCPNAISQAAYERALHEEPEQVARMRAEFDQRRRLLCRGLEALGLEFPYPRGAFYVFVDVSRWLDARRADGFCADLLEAESLALVPGSAFGVDSHVRLSYALDARDIETALERLGRFLTSRAARMA